MSVRLSPMADSVRRWGGWPLILGAALGLGVAANPPKSFAERIGPIRPGPGRLFGFAYAPVGWKPSTEQRRVLRGETVRLDQELATPENRTTERFRQRAIVLLAAEKESEAVEQLEEALESLPTGHPAQEEAYLRSDLAAAHLQLFTQRGKPVALLDALDNGEKAAELSSSPNAKFNLAVSLQRLFLKTEASREWTALVSQAPAEAWRKEGQENLEKLAISSQFVRWQMLHGNLSWLDSPTETTAIVAEFPQQVRTFAQEELLSNWGQAVLENRPVEASRLLAQATLVGKSLAAFNVELSVLDSAIALRETPAPLLPLIAQAHIAYATGRVEFEKAELKEAELSLSRALRLFEEVSPNGSPYRWTKYWLTCIAYYRQEHDAAIAQFRDILSRKDMQRYPALRGRLLWSLGLEHLVRAGYFESLSLYAQSMQIFHGLGETENLGALEYLSAENLELLGRPDEAWSYRNRALSHLSDGSGSVRRLNQLLQISRVLSQAGKEHAAYPFVSEALSSSRASSRQVQVCEALVVRASVGTRIGAFSQAKYDLERANRCVNEIPNVTLRERLRLESDISSAMLLSHDSPRDALTAFDALLQTAERTQRRIDVPQLLRARAGLYLNLMDSTHASQDLERAMRLIAEMARMSQSEKEKSELLALWQPLYDDGLDLYGFRNQDMVRALSVIEQSRGKGSVGSSLLRAVMEKMPPNFILVRIGTTEDGILIWLVSRQKVVSYSRRIASGRLSALIESFETTLRAGRTHQRSNNALFAMLGSAITNASKRDDLVVLVPDGRIANLTFAALRDPHTGRPLIAERSLTYFAGGLSSLVSEFPSNVSRCERRDLRMIAVGNPTLKNLQSQRLGNLDQAARDSSELAASYAGTILLNGADATKGKVLEGLRSADILYFAGHSDGADGNALEARLFLSGDVLRGAEIANLSLAHICLVVLSSCESARTAEVRAYGAGGLAAAFIRAGAQAVIGNTREVSDEAAQALVGVQQAILRGGPLIHVFRSMQVRAAQDSRGIAGGVLAFRLLLRTLPSGRERIV